jgi:hypothetical protein
MRKNRPRPPMLMEEGHCKSIRDTSWNEFDCPGTSPPETIEILLCLLEGVERRRRLMMQWSGGSLNSLSQVK